MRSTLRRPPRKDCGYGNEDIIEVCEPRACLLRLRRAAKAKRLIEQLFAREDGARATDASQGSQAIDGSLKLIGWSLARRVVEVRRHIKNDLALTFKQKSQEGKSEPGLSVLAPSAVELQDNAQMRQWTVLVTDIRYELAAIGRLYRDRCDCRACPVSGFDELKKQWGWGGCVTQDMRRSRLTVRAVALIYSWWSCYVRVANPQARREALTSRLLLLAAFGRTLSPNRRSRSISVAPDRRRQDAPLRLMGCLAFLSFAHRMRGFAAWCAR